MKILFSLLFITVLGCGHNHQSYEINHLDHYCDNGYIKVTDQQLSNLFISTKHMIEEADNFE